MAPKKTWTQKLTENRSPQVKHIDFPFAGIPPHSDMFIATPQIIQTYVSEIPAGKSVDIETLRKDLARANDADYTCPVTTGIFLRIVAEAAYENYVSPTSKITPFWRVVKPGSVLSKKLSCGEEFIIEKRKKERIK
jgi:hypothetical protein